MDGQRGSRDQRQATRLPAHPRRSARSPSHHRERGFSGFLAGSRGTAAVEFAILGLIFTLLLCFIVEIGMTMLMQSTLNDAAQAASRLIRTGSIQQSGGQPAPFQAALCSKVKLLMDCSQVRYDVVAGDRFSDLPARVQTDADSELVNTHFLPGTAEQDVMVQVGYTRSLYFPILRDILGNHGKLLILSTVVFQNEPY